MPRRTRPTALALRSLFRSLSFGLGRSDHGKLYPSLGVPFTSTRMPHEARLLWTKAVSLCDPSPLIETLYVLDTFAHAPPLQYCGVMLYVPPGYSAHEKATR